MHRCTDRSPCFCNKPFCMSVPSNVCVFMYFLYCVFGVFGVSLVCNLVSAAL